MVNFVYDSDIQAIFRNVSKLKGSGIFIRRDYVGVQKKVNEALNRFRRDLIGRNIRVTIGMDFMYYDGYKFQVDDRNGEMWFHSNRQDGCKFLSAKLGFDVAPLWQAAVEGKVRGRRGGRGVDVESVDMINGDVEEVS